MDDRLVVVLGNHDLHLLARAAGVAEPKRRDSLEEVLAAPDRDDLLAWLRTRPFVHREDGWLLVHAGLFPQWTSELVEDLAREVEEQLQGEAAPSLLASIDRKAPERWEEALDGDDRARVALAGFAKLRMLDGSGRMCADFAGPPEVAPRGCIPWFEVPGRRNADVRVIFGHWAALGLRLRNGIAALDTGCVWGRELTALRLDDGKVFQEPARD
jgi:bis(5'-nucleosyl)-tetraphosphatase (symmetrical)